MPEEQLHFFVRLLQLEKILPPLPTVNDQLSAAFFGVAPDGFQKIRAQLSGEVSRSAEVLLADSRIAAQLAALPFADGQVVLGLGDSLTADRLSWFEVLARAYRLRFPESTVQFVNAGVSGDATPQIVARAPFFAALKPAHVLFLGGGNDARRFGSPETPTQLSIAETERNLRLLRASFSGARWLSLAPASLDAGRAAASPFWASMATFWNAADLAAVSALVLRLDPQALDLRTVLDGNATLIGDDGLHPTGEGHTRMAAAVIARLAGT